MALFGKLDMYNGRRQMTSPVVDVLGGDGGKRTGRIVPIYPQSDKAGLSTWEIGDWVAEALRRSRVRGLADPVPEWVLDRYDLVTRGEAFAGIHAPENDGPQGGRPPPAGPRRAAAGPAGPGPAQAPHRAHHPRHRPADRGDLLGAFVARLPFELTGDQRHAIAEIATDLAAPTPCTACCRATWVRARRWWRCGRCWPRWRAGTRKRSWRPPRCWPSSAAGIRALLDGVEVPDASTSLFGARPVRVELLTNQVGAADRRRILAALAAGEVDVVIGTHALIQEGVEFASLGAVVIDEQHRFGVEQRAALRDKAGRGPVPDVLVAGRPRPSRGRRP